VNKPNNQERQTNMKLTNNWHFPESNGTYSVYGSFLEDGTPCFHAKFWADRPSKPRDFGPFESLQEAIEAKPQF
jgi:hypothetical protein